MGKAIKTIEQKLRTKLLKIDNSIFKITKKQVKVGSNILFKYSPVEIEYTKTRFFPSLKEEIRTEDFLVTILLDSSTLNILSSNICKPPKGAKIVLDVIRNIKPNIDHIVIGGEQCRIEGNSLFITNSIYLTFLSINREESVDKKVRVRNRVAPFLKEKFALECETQESDRDYSLLLQEVIASKKISQNDIVALTNELEVGENNEVVIKNQINKQAEWLLDSMQAIIDKPKLSKNDAQNLGHELFGFPKATISGPEALMEKILTKYGQHIIFGVPALLNTKKYVISATGFSNCQFDLILINYLSDIEIVELKRPDEYLFEYDSSRGKFYMSKTLSIATAQSERYISTFYKDNDPDFKIDGKNIKEYIDSKFGGTIVLSICRPKALIIIGAIHRLAKNYDDLLPSEKSKVSKRNYNKNLEAAYKELKASFKNIEITTYTEIIEGARLRSQLESD
jgi:hypothetical protein